MEPTQELLDDIYRKKVLRARGVPFEEKLMAGAVLFDEVRERMAEGIRMQYPHADEATVREILQKRHARLRQVREAR